VLGRKRKELKKLFDMTEPEGRKKRKNNSPFHVQRENVVDAQVSLSRRGTEGGGVESFTSKPSGVRGRPRKIHSLGKKWFPKICSSVLKGGTNN